MAKAKVNKKMGPTAVELPECPVCMEIMTAPIFQCQSGHSLCDSCTKNLLPPICPICRQTMTQMRNWQLEDLISKASVPCPNKSSGCVFTMAAMDVEDHLKECIFREMTCPLGIALGKCSWSGKLKDMLDHFKASHPNNCYINTDNPININNVSISTAERYMYLMPQGKFLFILTFMIDTCQNMAYWTVQLIGSKNAAKQYVYAVQVISKQDDKRQVIFTDKCFNDVFNTNEIFQQGRCGVMPLKMLSHFIKDGKLSLSFTVKKNQPNFKNKEKEPTNKGPNVANKQKSGQKPGPTVPKQKGQGNKNKQ